MDFIKFNRGDKKMKKEQKSIKGIKVILTILMLFLIFETIVHWFGLPILGHEHLYDTPYTTYLGRLVGLLTLIWAGYTYFTIQELKHVEEDLKKHKKVILLTIMGLLLLPFIEASINLAADLSNIQASGPYGIGISLKTALWRESSIAGILGLLLLYFYYKLTKGVRK